MSSNIAKSIERARVLKNLSASTLRARVLVKLHEKDVRSLSNLFTRKALYRSTVRSPSQPSISVWDEERPFSHIVLVDSMPVKSLDKMRDIWEDLARTTMAFEVNIRQSAVEQSKRALIKCIVESRQLVKLRNRLLQQMYELHGIGQEDSKLVPRGLTRFYRPFIMLQKGLETSDALQDVARLNNGRMLPEKVIVNGLSTEVWNAKHPAEVRPYLSVSLLSRPGDEEMAMQRARQRAGLLPP